MKKITILIFVVIALSQSSKAQQDPQFSQNMFNKLFVNPASAGASGAYCGSLLYRSQWAGYDPSGQPKTGVLSLDGPVKFLHGGLGLNILSDQLGFEKTIGVKLAYSFHLNVGESGKLGIGLDAGYMQKSVDGKKYKPNDPNDPFVPTQTVKGSVLPDLGAGIYYAGRRLYAGISASHLTEGEIDLTVTKYNLARHIYGTLGYRFDITPTIGLTPSVFVKNDGATTQVDGNLMAMFNDKFWLGASYRLEDAIVVMAGFNVLNGLRIGYSYDITSSQLKNYSDGSHEVTLGYCFNPKKKPILRNINVRYL